ncbi:hypothetical protein CEXT_641821 [Caerostris extrusa]|uniref:Uncharacterized protein n=1 Tax=Caerostris extrusa TaxID=172846 RepID=A0AAV4PE41_CAEEX|nr:hypothetical protein CEXT_641821 [Caerostris extrusa]
MSEIIHSEETVDLEIILFSNVILLLDLRSFAFSSSERFATTIARKLLFPQYNEGIHIAVRGPARREGIHREGTIILKIILFSNAIFWPEIIRPSGIGEITIITVRELLCEQTAMSERIHREETVMNEGIHSEDTVMNVGIHSEDTVMNVGIHSEDTVMNVGIHSEETVMNVGIHSEETVMNVGIHSEERQL